MGVIIAAFHLGIYDGKRLLLPCDPDAPWPRFVIPQEEGSLILEHFYLRASRVEDHLWDYLWDDSFQGIAASI